MEAHITQEQILTLKYLIFKAEDVGQEIKKICYALINASIKNNSSVYFTIHSEKVANDISTLMASSGSTHLHQLTMLMGTNYHFSNHAGYFDTPGVFLSHSPKGSYNHTIWFAIEDYDDNAKPVGQKEVDEIDLRDRLYGDIR